MSISLKTHKLLWLRSGNKCAFEGCRNELVADETETDDVSIIGDEAHIVSSKTDGPRGDYLLPIDQRDEYKNLILLCRIHHKIIDDQPNYYTVERLIKFKMDHEKWVKETQKTDSKTYKDDLTYSSYLDEIFKLLDIENWNAWTSYLISMGESSISYKRLMELNKIPDYTISRYWPNSLIELEQSIYNLKNILNDLIKVFYKHVDYDSLEKSKNSESDILVHTERFYKINEWNHERYYELLDEFNYHIDLVDDLTLELTRAANFVIEKVRKFISPKYREKEGKLLITSGPYMDMSWKTYIVEYSIEEKKSNRPYSSLKQFMTERANRDISFGEGFNENYFPEDILEKV